MPKLESIWGIESNQVRLLSQAGILGVNDLRTRGSTRNGRYEIAMATGIRESAILQWVNYLDLLRIQRIGEGSARLLIMAGIGSVEDLAIQKPIPSIRRLNATNEKFGIVGQIPNERYVDLWITIARTLKPLVEQ